MERGDAFRWGVLRHGWVLRGNAEQRIVRARLHAHRVLGARFVDDVDRVDAALGDALDLAGPAHRHVAGLHPVVHDRAIELESARDIRLAAENLDESLCAVHGSAESNLSNLL
jgi:hypothetical protein